MEKLPELFPPNEVMRIKQIVPGMVDDCFVCAYSRHGAYTVKTVKIGYELLATTKTLLLGPISPEEKIRITFKKRIWKLLTLPKIRMFLWRAVSGALAVAERLNTRGLGVDNTCKLCQGAPEMINHILFECPIATRIWSDVGLPSHGTFLQHSLEENLAHLFDLMEDTHKPVQVSRSIPWVCWLIWKNINSILYAETQVSLDKLRGDMAEEVDQWFKLNEVSLTGTMERCLHHHDSWSPPTTGTIKCNIHGNWSNAHLHSGLSWIARDCSGNVSHHARYAIVQAPNRMVSEFRCVIWAMKSLSDLGVTTAIFASDYREVIEAIKYPLRWPQYRDLLRHVIKFKEKFSLVAFEEEKVSANGIACDIAKSVLRDGRFQSYLAMGDPSWLLDRLARERNGNNF